MELTDQQVTVLIGFASGKRTKELAGQLNCSPKTIEYHRTAIFAKLGQVGVKPGSIADLTRYAIENGYLVGGADMSKGYTAALRALGVVDFQLKTQADYDRLMDIWREKTIEARHNCNDELAAQLSQCKEAIKVKWGIYKGVHCPRCGKLKRKHTAHCEDCAELLTGTNGAPPEEPTDLYQVIDSAYVVSLGRPSAGLLTQALRKLVKVGDSFLTDKCTASVKNAAKSLKIQVLCYRVTPRGIKKPHARFRVWRSDGLKPNEINKIIKERLDATRSISEAPAPQSAGAPQPISSGP